MKTKDNITKDDFIIDDFNRYELMPTTMIKYEFRNGTLPPKRCPLVGRQPKFYT